MKSTIDSLLKVYTIHILEIEIDVGQKQFLIKAHAFDQKWNEKSMHHSLNHIIQLWFNFFRFKFKWIVFDGGFLKYGHNKEISAF